ncbi:hypothetical protein QFZ20_002205 [Flavobacterium sp. W4I14]|nr:hypothetical protein [Flavobacterium sp. W4I14]
MKGIKLYIIIITLILSCSSSDSIKVYRNRSLFLKEFKDLSVMRSRGKNTIIFYSYLGKLKNEYFLSVDENLNYKLTSRNLIFDEYELGRKLVDSSQIINFVKQKLQIMDRYEVRDISSEFRDMGINMQIYFNSLESLTYVENPVDVKNNEWLKYLREVKKLDNHWYYDNN